MHRALVRDFQQTGALFRIEITFESDNALDAVDANVSELALRVIELGEAVARARADLAASQVTLVQNDIDLGSARAALSHTNVELAATQRALAQVKANLVATRAAWAKSDADVAMLRREVEALKRDVAAAPTTLETLDARTDVLWRWVNAYALTGGPVPVNLPQEVAVIRWGLDDGRGPDETVVEDMDFFSLRRLSAIVDGYERISDAESFSMTRRLAREEGLLVGGSSGMAVVGALRVARDLPADAVVVVVLPDHGRGYLSKIFDDDWMIGYGFLRTEGAVTTAGDVLASKDGSIPDLVVITDDVVARDAVARMRDLGVSQLIVAVTDEPPLAAKEISGMVSELPLMDKAFHAPDALEGPVADVMEPAPPMVGVGETVSDVVDRLDRCSAVLVLDGGHPVGVLTRSDVLTFLASRAPA